MASSFKFMAWGLLLTLPWISAEVRAQASAERITGQCYRIKAQDSPASIEHSPEGEGAEEVWCYRPVEGKPGATFIFNADDERVRPELSAVVDAEGIVSHGSLREGKVSVHRLRASEFNPLPVPLTPPGDAVKVASDSLVGLAASADETLKLLDSDRSMVQDMRVRDRPGLEKRAATVPWRGYWWPTKDGWLHEDGASSPMGKLDQFISARGGEAKALEWEERQHRFNGLKWEGHCNGWAASAILRPEPRRPIRDEKSGVRFTVSDLKGLLAEREGCAKLTMYGKRYRHKDDNLRDIRPGLFHQVLRYYIGVLDKPIVMDRLPNEEVGNQIISGYSMNIRRTAVNTYSVSATLTIHKYDKVRVEKPGPAPAVRLTYKYVLKTDRDGSILDGRWLTGNPDFFWVPLSSSKCTTANPYVTDQWLDQILDQASFESGS